MKYRNTLRVLNSIGKENFIRFYEDYKKYYLSNNKKADREILAKKLLNDNIKAQKISGQYTRINCAARIFEAKAEVEVLNIIINSRVSEEVKYLAKEILQKYEE